MTEHPTNKSEEKIGHYVEYLIDSRLRSAGKLIGYMGEYALVRDSDDNVKAIETWRIK